MKFQTLRADISEYRDKHGKTRFMVTVENIEHIEHQTGPLFYVYDTGTAASAIQYILDAERSNESFPACVYTYDITIACLTSSGRMLLTSLVQNIKRSAWNDGKRIE